MEASSKHPYPPIDLATRVLSIPGDPDPIATYEELGNSTRLELLDLLPDDWTFEGKRMLDFGCGAGRTLRHFIDEAKLPDTEFWGSDIDVPSIEWLQQNLSPPFHLIKGDVDPPLPLEANSVDFAWAISVFTHLADSSAAWLMELHRILKPGGLLMASYMGEWNSEAIAGEPWDENRIGMNVLNHDQGWDHGGPMIFMSNWWVQEHWGRAFEIVKVNPRVHNQTWALLRKKDVSITPEELMAAGPDPREVTALRHNISQVQREVVRSTTQLHDRYEHSLSWKSTGWLRTGRQAAERTLERLKKRA